MRRVERFDYVQECSRGMTSRSSLTKAYAGLVTFNLEVTEIAKAYGDWSAREAGIVSQSRHSKQ